MKIQKFLCRGCFIPNLAAGSKKEAMDQLAIRASEINPSLNSAEVISILEEREQLGSTGIGGGVAIPHGRITDLEHMIIIVGRTHKGISFDSPDKKPVHIIFLLLAPDDSATVYLKILARITRLLKIPEAYRQLMNAKDESSLVKIIKKAEESL